MDQSPLSSFSLYGDAYVVPDKIVLAVVRVKLSGPSTDLIMYDSPPIVMVCPTISEVKVSPAVRVTPSPNKFTEPDLGGGGGGGGGGGSGGGGVTLGGGVGVSGFATPGDIGSPTSIIKVQGVRELEPSGPPKAVKCFPSIIAVPLTTSLTNAQSHSLPTTKAGLPSTPSLPNIT